jgi:hypothetical protein
MGTYSVHKLASAFLFAALSITIGDWASVLKDINEYGVHVFLFRRATLISLNILYITISIINFVLCLVLSDLNAYLNSPMYTCAIFLQIIMNCLLTSMMLHAGLKLYARIHGAVGNIDQSSYTGYSDKSSHRSGGRAFTTSTTNPMSGAPPVISSSPSFSQSMSQPLNAPSSPSRMESSRSKSSQSASRLSVAAVDGNLELKNALNNLNFVMATCTVCILLQMIMLTLNYALGYSNQANKTVGPPLFYWTCSYYIPLWGPILALLYLSRSQSHRKRAKFLSMRRASGDNDLDGSRTSFSPMKLPTSRTTNAQHRQFSSDTDDLEAYYLQEQLQSPLIDAANLMEYSVGHHSHDMLYSNNLLAAAQQAGKESSSGKRKKKRDSANRSLQSVEASQASHTGGNAAESGKPRRKRVKARVPANVLDVLTLSRQRQEQQPSSHQPALESSLPGNSFSHNPTHVSMSLGEISEDSSAMYQAQHAQHLHDTIDEGDEDDADKEYDDEYDEDEDGSGDDEGPRGDPISSERLSEVSTVDTHGHSLFSDSFMQFRDTNMTSASLPSELIFPHNFNFNPPHSSSFQTPISTNNTANCKSSHNRSVNSHTQHGGGGPSNGTGRHSSANTASIAARLVSRGQQQSQQSGSTTTGDGHSEPTGGRLNSHDYSYHGEEERFDGVFR